MFAGEAIVIAFESILAISLFGHSSFWFSSVLFYHSSSATLFTRTDLAIETKLLVDFSSSNYV